MIPYLCPELPEKQKEALHYGVKVPLVYTSVAIRNWKSSKSFRRQTISCPGMYHVDQMNLDIPQLILAGYESPKKPDEPILVRMERTPCLPGLPERDQHRAGRGDLLSTSFETFERSIRDQLRARPRRRRVRSRAAISTESPSTGGRTATRTNITICSIQQWPKGQSPCEIGGNVLAELRLQILTLAPLRTPIKRWTKPGER